MNFFERNKVFFLGLFLSLSLFTLLFYLFNLNGFLSSRVYWTLILFSLAFLLYCLFANQGYLKERHLERNLEDKEELISIASHELSAPLTNIKGTLSLLSKEVPPSSQVYLRRALTSVEQLISLIDGLLTVSRFEMGKMKIILVPVQVEDLCQEVVNDFQAEAAAKGLFLEFVRPSQRLPKVMLDPQRIREVLVNLVSNGLKYTHSGGIRVAGRLQDSHLMVSVTDTGSGIKEENLEILFNRFVRLVDGQKESPKGIGLGLYISRLIVEAHLGRIWAQSQVGKGSVFSFTLPLV